MNEKSFSHISHYGTAFDCDRCDFRTPIVVSTPPEDPRLYVKDVAEMIGFHTTNIHPELNGFQGYDCIEFVPAIPPKPSKQEYICEVWSNQYSYPHAEWLGWRFVNEKAFEASSMTEALEMAEEYRKKNQSGYCQVSMRSMRKV